MLRHCMAKQRSPGQLVIHENKLIGLRLSIGTYRDGFLFNVLQEYFVSLKQLIVSLID